MKKIIVQLDSGRAPSLFDAVTAHDFGVDVVIPCGGIQPNEVADRHFPWMRLSIADLHGQRIACRDPFQREKPSLLKLQATVRLIMSLSEERLKSSYNNCPFLNFW
jgi:hypothetical protein